MKKNLNALAQTVSDKLSEGNVKEMAEALWFELQLGKKTGQLDHLLEDIREKIAEKKKTTIATVLSKGQLGDVHLRTIREKLEKKYSRKFQVNNVIDPDVLGGFKIQIDDEVIDFSWKEKLNAIKARMVGANE
jgi:F-type H+-transporting ATPase subunit delta